MLQLNWFSAAEDSTKTAALAPPKKVSHEFMEAAPAIGSSGGTFPLRLAFPPLDLQSFNRCPGDKQFEQGFLPEL
jgi:hypothetical protein